MDKNKPVWFAAKRHGWGWGLPTCSQGWLVYISYLAILLVACLALLPSNQIAELIGCVVLATAVLLVICLLKGERPRWRSGND